MKTVVAVILGSVLALSACGGSSSSPSTTAPESPTASATPAPTGSTVGLGALSADCQKVVAGLGAGSNFSSLPAGSTPADFAKQARDAMRSVAAQAPSGSVRDAFNTLADAYNKFADALKNVNYDPSAGAAPPAAYLSAIQAFASPSFGQASATVSTWIGTNCH